MRALAPLLLMIALASGISYDVCVNVGDVYQDPFGNLMLTLLTEGQKTMPASLSDGGRNFKSNVLFNTTIELTTDLEGVSSLFLRWQTVDISQIITVYNVTFTGGSSHDRVYCSQSAISMLYLSQDFEYVLCH